ncbi:hypothetical protein JTB14_005578 [Gonioctena quinquepunctata]|nr:hypothetical protein JTB14_005578 [Gonioctena quinquepunctata]
MREELVLKETDKIRRKEKEVARVKKRISLKDQKQVLKNRNKKQAKTKQKKRTKKKHSDSEDEEIVIPFSDDEVVNEDDVEQPSYFDALTEVPKKHDYVLVEFKIRENNIVYYVGKILTDKDKNDEFEISFFRKSIEMHNKFILPNILDIALIPLTNIKMKLPEPVLLGMTKLHQSYLDFGVSFGTLKIN